MSRTLAIFGIKLKKDLQAKLLEEEKKKAAKYGRSANQNSRLWGSIKVKFDNPENPNTLTLTMNSYWYWVDKGRKRGSVAERADINDWIKRKNISPVKIIEDMKMKAGIKSKKKVKFQAALKQVDFIVRRKLRRVGFEGNEFYTQIINDGRLVQLGKDLKIELQREVFINVGNTR